MSSTTANDPTSTTPFSAPTVSPTPTDDGGGGGMARGANYFFGFLITFVVLLLIFVACGIGSRRRFIARRRAMLLGDFDPWGVEDGTQPRHIQHVPPKFFEPAIIKGGVAWDSVMPLAASFIPKLKERDDSNDTAEDRHLSPVPTTAPTRQPRRFLPSFAFHSGIHRSGRKAEQEEKEKDSELDPPDEMGVTVMIVMPTPHDKLPHNEGHRLPEYQLGTARVPWIYEEIPR
ncbi:hypothetical protein BDQ17DRAFT_1347553 [Cyathus striatus]|nr:hypothetical protein BDQ17DRAFT_1347553 [Cyathus striatus]